MYIERFFDAETLAKLYTAVTGVEATPADLYRVGERVWNLFKMLNLRAGFDRQADRAPEAWFTPLKGEGMEFSLMDYYKTAALTREDMERVLDDYYDERGWDPRTGIPTSSKLAQLGLPTA